MRDVGIYIIAAVLSASTAMMCTIIEPALSVGYGQIVNGLVSFFGVFFYADAIRLIIVVTGNER